MSAMEALRTATEAIRTATQALRRARAAGTKPTIPPEFAAALRGLGDSLKMPVKRGRPKDPDLEQDRLNQALEYYDLRISGVPARKAISIVFGERHDGSTFEHSRRRPRSIASFLRDMRARWSQVSNALDLVTWNTQEQIAALREELDNKSKSKKARTRK